jgi:chromosome segregation ATPase
MKFKRNVSQRIINNKKINEQLSNNVELLKNEINNNYGELTKTKYNFYNINNNTITTLFNNRVMKLKNRTNHQKINDLKTNIKDIKNKIEQLNRKTALYTNENMILNNEVINLKKQCKILPNLIDNLENENQALISTKNIIQKSIQKIKSKLLEFELYKNNIERNLKNANMLYE